eukprot:m.252086 g.252086  ORF g.252086 m.252086 type:complete len:340 (-) comp19551_c1_seq2:35-1054(-)
MDIDTEASAGCAPRPKGYISTSSYPSFMHEQLVGHEGAVMAARFTHTGAYCLTSSRDKSIKLWNPQTGMCIKTYKGHGRDVNDAVGSVDNSRIASAGGDKMVFLWDVGTGQTITRFRGHTSTVNCVRFNKDSTVIISASYDRSVQFWDMRSNNFHPIMTLEEAKDSIPTMDVVDAMILTGSVDGHVRLYDIRMGAMREDYMKDPVTSVQFSHDRNCILASTLNSTVRLLDKESGEMLAEYTGRTNTEYKVDAVLSHNDAYVVSGSEDGDLCYWDLVSGRMLHRASGAHGKSVVASLAYHPKAPMLLSASLDGVVKVWHTVARADGGAVAPDTSGTQKAA